MTEGQGQPTEERAADPSGGDFTRGGTANATGRATGGVAVRLDEAPPRYLGAAAVVGLTLAVPVVWSTWASPGLGAAVAAVAGLAALAGVLLAFHAGWAAGSASRP